MINVKKCAFCGNNNHRDSPFCSNLCERLSAKVNNHYEKNGGFMSQTHKPVGQITSNILLIHAMPDVTGRDMVVYK